jgi:hypothetical protein
MKIAKSRSWTEDEVKDAIAALKREPGLWEELERIEATTGEFTDTKAGFEQRRIISRSHPECELNEITDLLLAIRLRPRASPGVK